MHKVMDLKSGKTVFLNREMVSMDDITLSIIIIIVLSLIGVCADSIIKISTHHLERTTMLTFLLIGAIIYALTAIGWFFVMKNVKLIDIAVFYPVFTTLFLVAMGVFYFGEKINAKECIGIVLAVLAIALILSSMD